MPRHTSADTRADLLAAATAAFTAQGLRGTSLADIAQAAGYSKATVLYHFQTKEQLVRQWARDLLDGLSRLATELGRTTDVAARQDLAVSGFVDLALQHRVTMRLLQAEITYVLNQEAMTDARVDQAVLREALCAGDDSTAAAVGAVVFIAGVAAAAAEFPAVEPAVLRQTVWTLVEPLLGLTRRAR